MVPDTENDSAQSTKPSQEEHYTVDQLAVRDGILDAIGTISLLGFSLLFLFIGVRGLFIGSSTVFSSLFVVAACLMAAAAFNLIPPFRG